MRPIDAFLIGLKTLFCWALMLLLAAIGAYIAWMWLGETGLLIYSGLWIFPLVTYWSWLAYRSFWEEQS